MRTVAIGGARDFEKPLGLFQTGDLTVSQIIRVLCVTAGAFLLMASVASAQDAGDVDVVDAVAAQTPLSLSAIGAGLALIGGALGIGRIGGSAVEAMARQPEVAGQIQTAMIIAAALVEGATFFALIVCIIK